MKIKVWFITNVDCNRFRLLFPLRSPGIRDRIPSALYTPGEFVHQCYYSVIMLDQIFEMISVRKLEIRFDGISPVSWTPDKLTPQCYAVIALDQIFDFDHENSGRQDSLRIVHA